MVKKVIRIDKQRPEGAVLPARDLCKDVTYSDLGTFFQRGSVFASYIAMLAYAQDEPDMNEVDIQGEKRLVTCHQKGFPYPAIEDAKPFAVEAFCHFKSCHLFSVADGAPRVLVGRVLQDCDTDMMTLRVELMARVPENVARTFTEEKDMVWSLLDATSERRVSRQRGRLRT